MGRQGFLVPGNYYLTWLMTNTADSAWPWQGLGLTDRTSIIHIFAWTFNWNPKSGKKGRNAVVVRCNHNIPRHQKLHTVHMTISCRVVCSGAVVKHTPALNSHIITVNCYYIITYKSHRDLLCLYYQLWNTNIPEQWANNSHKYDPKNTGLD